ncbi:hypothetical protein BLNAU_677 [Blattamonas nauphoetae]|uniref:Uncharacterized protein n=1 Tax=Blattamonas nauphoetae TaxID=2049346 RepID=A0ABQ9YKG3_9EUKA|nr:hypothetical protein BLNAU_677 [Blattamonas nauphoetae]
MGRGCPCCLGWVLVLLGIFSFISSLTHYAINIQEKSEKFGLHSFINDVAFLNASILVCGAFFIFALTCLYPTNYVVTKYDIIEKKK